MHTRHAARAGLVATVVGVTMMALAAVAFACTNLATLNLSSSAGAPGTTITATGSSFATAKGAVPAAAVVLHFNSATGPALASVVPDGAGNVSASFVVPQSAQPGYAVIVATQTKADGSSAYGTPARASFQVTANGNAPTALQPANNGGIAQAASSSSSSGILALTIGLGVLGLALFGAGLTAFVRQARRREVGVPAKVRGE